MKKKFLDAHRGLQKADPFFFIGFFWYLPVKQKKDWMALTPRRDDPEIQPGRFGGLAFCQSKCCREWPCQEMTKNILKHFNEQPNSEMCSQSAASSQSPVLQPAQGID